MRALIPSIFSMLYCRCWPSLKPFNPPKQQEKQTEVERGAAGMKAVALKLISRPLTKLSDTGGAKGQCIYSASGAVDKSLNGTWNWDSVCAMFHFKLGEGRRRAAIVQVGVCFVDWHTVSVTNLSFLFYFSLSVCCSPTCFLSSPTVALSAGERMTSNWHVNWWKEKNAQRNALLLCAPLSVSRVSMCIGRRLKGSISYFPELTFSLVFLTIWMYNYWASNPSRSAVNATCLPTIRGHICIEFKFMKRAEQNRNTSLKRDHQRIPLLKMNLSLKRCHTQLIMAY